MPNTMTELAVRSETGDLINELTERNPILATVPFRAANKGIQNVAKKLESVGIGAFRSYTVREDMLIKFVRSHVAAEMKVNQMFSDRAVIDYHELVLDFKGTLKNVFDFLDVPFSPACIPNRKNQNIRTIEETVSNYSVLKSELPLDVADFLESHSLV